MWDLAHNTLEKCDFSLFFVLIKNVILQFKPNLKSLNFEFFNF